MSVDLAKACLVSVVTLFAAGLIKVNTKLSRFGLYLVSLYILLILLLLTDSYPWSSTAALYASMLVLGFPWSFVVRALIPTSTYWPVPVITLELAITALTNIFLLYILGSRLTSKRQRG
jgi:hypothetical protein